MDGWMNGGMMMNGRMDGTMDPVRYFFLTEIYLKHKRSGET